MRVKRSAKAVLFATTLFAVPRLFGANVTSHVPVDYEQVVAIVNGEKITRGDLAEALIRVSGHRALDVLVKRKLIDQEAAKAGIKITKADIQQGIKDRIDELLGLQMHQAGYENMEDFKRFLATKNLSLQAARRRIAGTLSPDIYEETEAVLKAVKLIETNVKITDEDLQKRYDQQYGPRIEASQIVVKSRRDAQEVRRKLQMGADFERLAKDLSIDRKSGARGGRMSTPIRPSDGALWAVCKNLRRGDISDIARSRYGYHILKIESIRSAPKKTLDQVRGELMAAVREEKGRDYLRTWYVNLLQRSDVRKMLPKPRLPGPIPIPKD